jgi:hypothetical protein
VMFREQANDERPSLGQSAVILDRKSDVSKTVTA